MTGYKHAKNVAKILLVERKMIVVIMMEIMMNAIKRETKGYVKDSEEIPEETIKGFVKKIKLIYDE